MLYHFDRKTVPAICLWAAHHLQLLTAVKLTTPDEFFDYPSLAVNPQSTAAHGWVSDPYDYYGPITYDPDNEPNLLAPYMYAWTGRPDKTATVVRAAETLYTTAPGGMTGNDDMGETWAWYVMSAIGLYPTMSGSNFYVVTTPLFPTRYCASGTTRTSRAAPSPSRRSVPA
jgi:putative alpha-1,2-mannosidase